MRNNYSIESVSCTNTSTCSSDSYCKFSGTFIANTTATTMLTENINITTTAPPTTPTTTQETVKSSETNASTANPLGICKKGIRTKTYIQWNILVRTLISSNKASHVFCCFSIKL